MQIFANIWVVGTLLLFYFGPVHWEGASDGWVAVVVLAAMTGLNLGCMSIPFQTQCSYRTMVPTQLLKRKDFSYGAIAVFIALSALQIYNATGLSFLSTSDWSFDFGSVYMDYQGSTRNYLDSSPIENMLFVGKALLFPTALVIFCRYFQKDRILAALFLFPMIGSSFMRGTDKETFDVLLIVLVCAFFYGYKRQVIISSLALLPVVMFLFIERKLGRREDLPACFDFVCLNYDSLLSLISPKLEFGWVMAMVYVTNGYQGLSTALEVSFEPHLGLGHLPPLEQLVCSVTGLMCDMSTYNERITDAGWDASYRWTSAFPTLANDMHFFFIPVYMFFLGRIMRSAEIFWRDERSPVALATLVMFAIFFAYLSANMQVAISLDWAIGWIALVYVPLLTLKRRRRLKMPHRDAVAVAIDDAPLGRGPSFGPATGPSHPTGNPGPYR